MYLCLHVCVDLNVELFIVIGNNHIYLYKIVSMGIRVFLFFKMVARIECMQQVAYNKVLCLVPGQYICHNLEHELKLK